MLIQSSPPLRFIASVFVCCVAFLALTATTTLAQSVEIQHYQKVKNVTRGDDPRGDVLTVAGSGDELRYLILIKNRSEQTVDLRVRDTLPPFAIYQPGTAKFFRDGQSEWLDLANNETSFPLKDYALQLPAGSFGYFKFHTQVKPSLPATNLTDDNFVQVTSSTGEVWASSLTKVVLPNAPVSMSTAEAAKLSQAEQKRVNELLRQESEIIEKMFFDALAAKQDTAKNSQLANESDSDFDFSFWLASVIILSVIGTELYYHYHRKHD